MTRASAGARGGRGLASNTSLRVVSGEVGVLHSRSVSYFDVSRPPWELELAPAQAGEAGSGELAPTRAGGAGSGDGLPLELGDVGQLASGWGVSLQANQTVWEILSDGAVLGFQPYVLAGGSTADIEIELLVARNNPRTYPPGVDPVHVPLDSVAMHRTHTSVYVDSLDLFALSSLSLTTSHPRPDYEVPILSDLPIIGEMFKFERGNQSVHHESVMLVYATILPTGTDFFELIDFRPAASGR